MIVVVDVVVVVIGVVIVVLGGNVIIGGGGFFVGLVIFGGNVIVGGGDSFVGFVIFENNVIFGGGGFVVGLDCFCRVGAIFSGRGVTIWGGEGSRILLTLKNQIVWPSSSVSDIGFPMLAIGVFDAWSNDEVKLVEVAVVLVVDSGVSVVKQCQNFCTAL